MLIAFDSPAYARITMFADNAKQLLAMMGMSGAVPGALRAEDVPAALERLQRALTALPAEAPPAPPQPGEEPSQHVSMKNRAYPLIQLLEAAAKKNKHVVWEAAR